MTEYFTLKRIDNSRLVRAAAPQRWRELGRKMLGGAALGVCLLTYAWQHFECIQLRYSLEQLQAAKTQATELNQQLRLEVASLASPMRIDAIARQQLGLSVPVPGQVAPAQGSVEGVVAQVRTPSAATRP
jgi:cell division protein FtsL